MKILYLTSWFPFPLNTGARVRNYNLIKNLAKKHQIDLLSFISKKEEEAYIPGLKAICQRIGVVLAENRKYTFWENLAGFLLGTPRSIRASFSEELAGLVSGWTTEKKYDLIIIENIIMAQYVLEIKNITRVFDHHNVEAVILERHYKFQKILLKQFRCWLAWKKGLKYEREVSSKIEAHTFVSAVDKKILMDLIVNNDLSEVVPNGVDLNSFIYSSYEDKQRDPNLIIFSSLLKYPANLDGLRFFCSEIFPIIKRARPCIKLQVTGDHSNIKIDDLRDDKNVEFTGYVDDVKKLIAKAGVSIVSLQIGSGTRFKILESMALGTPVVSNSIGAEGIEGLNPVIHPGASSLEPGADFNIWIADEPEKFAEGVLALLSDKKSADILSKNARKLIEERYDWVKIAGSMDNFLEKVKANAIFK